MAKELKFYELALNTFKEEVKNAILSGEIPVDWENPGNKDYLATGRFVVCDAECAVSVSEKWVCYHNPLLKGIFNKEEDFKALKAIVKQHTLTEEENARIEELQAEIDRIQHGKI